MSSRGAKTRSILFSTSLRGIPVYRDDDAISYVFQNILSSRLFEIWDCFGSDRSKPRNDPNPGFWYKPFFYQCNQRNQRNLRFRQSSLHHHTPLHCFFSYLVIPADAGIQRTFQDTIAPLDPGASPGWQNKGLQPLAPSLHYYNPLHCFSYICL